MTEAPTGCGLVLGGNVFGWTIGDKESFAVLDRFLELGGSAIDTADVYYQWAAENRGGESEEIIGRWLAQRRNRDRVFLMTKVGMWDRRPGLSVENITAAIEDSLRRLRTDHVDLYFAHVYDPATPLEESLSAFDRLIRAGKVRTIGAANYPADRLAELLTVAEERGTAPVTAVQYPYSLMDREPYESAVAPLAARHGLAVYPYYCLGKGFLTGKYRHGRSGQESPRAQGALKYEGVRGDRVLATLEFIAAGHGVGPAAIALAWVRSRREVVLPLASARTPKQLDDLAASAAVTLTVPEVDALRAASTVELSEG